MAELSSATYSETDASNNAASPDGWPEGMAMAGINNSGRQVQGAVKRFWGRIQGRYASTGSANAYVLTYDVALAAYVTGERYSFRANFANTGAATLNISALGAKTIKKFNGGTKVDLAAGDIQSGQPVTVEYDGTDLIVVSILPPSMSSADAGATEGPVFDLFRNSASPADNDVIGAVAFSGKDESAATLEYAKVRATIVDATGGTTDSQVDILTRSGGALSSRMTVKQGVVVGSVDDKGVNSINATKLYQGNNKVGAVLLEVQQASNSAAIDFVSGFNGDFDTYLLVLVDVVPQTDATELLMRVSEDAGANFENGASDYGWTAVANTDAGAASGAGDASDASIRLLAGAGNASGESICGAIELFSPSNTSFHKKIHGRFTYNNASSTEIVVGGIYKGSTLAINAYRILFSSGNVASGGFYLYGITKATG